MALRACPTSGVREVTDDDREQIALTVLEDQGSLEWRDLAIQVFESEMDHWTRAIASAKARESQR